MLKKLIFALLAFSLLTCISFAENVTVSTLPKLGEALTRAASGDHIGVTGALYDSVGFTVNDDVTLESDSYTPGEISLIGSARVVNKGIIEKNAVSFSSGTPSIENLGQLYLNSVPAGAVLTNRGWVMSTGGLDLGGTFILESGSSLNFSVGSVSGSKNVIRMSLGARFVNKTNKTYTAILPDGTGVSLWGNTDFTVIKPSAPKIYLEDTGASGQRMLTITSPDAGATIYFTIDGSDPNIYSNIYQKSVYVSANANVKACARLTNSVMSDIADSLSAAAGINEAAPEPAEPAPAPALPTPAESAPAKVSSPVINISGGTYPCRQMLTLSCDTVGAKIYYTLDGSTPTESSPLYTGTFDIVSSATVKAIAFKADMQPSDLLTEHYRLLSYTVAQTDYSDPVSLDSFWSGCVNRIKAANGKTVTANAADCPYLPVSVIKALNEYPTELVITRSSGKTLTLPAGKAPDDYAPASRVWYSLDFLAASLG